MQKKKFSKNSFFQCRCVAMHISKLHESHTHCEIQFLFLHHHLSSLFADNLPLLAPSFPFAHLALRFVDHGTTCATSHSAKMCSMVTRVIYLLILFAGAIMQICEPESSDKNRTIAKQFSYNGKNCGQIRSIFYASRKIPWHRAEYTAYTQSNNMKQTRENPLKTHKLCKYYRQNQSKILFLKLQTNKAHTVGQIPFGNNFFGCHLFSSFAEKTPRGKAELVYGPFNAPIKCPKSL